MVNQRGSLEDLGVNNFWKNKRVLVTGHTGFKGSWLNLLLNELGSNVFGYALEPEPQAILFQQLELHKQSGHFIGNILDQNLFDAKVSDAQPDIVFHLAAQPLVRRSYSEPRETWQTNVIGTINLLEAVKQLKHECSVVIVTTDKVYENINANHAYSEDDRLGGHDPYSSSKAATELAVDSWRSSFFADNSNIKIASVRAGNVIGGGDWSEDRIIPDLVRALSENKDIVVRMFLTHCLAIYYLQKNYILATVWNCKEHLILVLMERVFVLFKSLLIKHLKRGRAS
jgi:CDP-glucose 4,6-dehydratase